MNNSKIADHLLALLPFTSQRHRILQLLGGLPDPLWWNTDPTGRAIYR